MKSLIVIPARYGSTRFHGKPLVMIARKPMIQRVYEIAKEAAKGLDCEVVVATEDSPESQKIVDFCESIGAKCMITTNEAKTGTDRVCDAVKKIGYRPDFIVNLQGDAPLTPPWAVRAMIDEAMKNPDLDMTTIGIRMGWNDLDKMRENKKTTPFSGTTIIMDQKTNNAIWFSKNIIPAIRKESDMREKNQVCPIIRHVGLYGYSYDMLMKFGELPESYYEKLEGLEQLRVLENGGTIRVAIVDYRGRPNSSGVDSPEDAERTEALIKEYGELL